MHDTRHDGLPMINEFSISNEVVRKLFQIVGERIDTLEQVFVNRVTGIHRITVEQNYLRLRQRKMNQAGVQKIQRQLVDKVRSRAGVRSSPGNVVLTQRHEVNRRGRRYQVRWITRFLSGD